MPVPSDAETTLLAILDRARAGQLPDLARMVFERAAAALRISAPLTRDLPTRLRMQREQVAEGDRDAFEAALAVIECAAAVPRTQVIRPPIRQAILVAPEEPEAALRMFPTRFSQAPSGVYQIHTIYSYVGWAEKTIHPGVSVIDEIPHAGVGGGPAGDQVGDHQRPDQASVDWRDGRQSGAIIETSRAYNHAASAAVEETSSAAWKPPLLLSRGACTDVRIVVYSFYEYIALHTNRLL